MKDISIIIPVFNEEDTIEELTKRLRSVLRRLPYNFKYVFIDDGSKDKTLQKLLEVQKISKGIKIIKLSRNWGHQNAYNAGLDCVSSEAVVLMDGDLQDPPEIIPKMIKEWENGYDIVYAVKEKRAESLPKKILISIFYKLMQRFSWINVDQQAGMFSLLDKKAYQQLKQCKERHKYYVGLRFFLGFNQTKIVYKRGKRFAGRPKQTFFKLINYALDAFFSFSFLPLRILTYFGIFMLSVISIFTGFIIATKIFNVKILMVSALPGWTSIALLVMAVLAIQIIFMGILGEYIARIFDEVRTRPYYIIDKIYN